MPCNCDHMEPTDLEIRLSQIACLFNELDGKPCTNSSYRRGFHPDIYSQTYDKYNSPESEKCLTERLVSRIRQIDIAKYSLEMQIWWRDHQAAVKYDERKRADKKKVERLRTAALKKLTPQERRLFEL